VIVGAPDLERVRAFETEHDSTLVVHANSVQPSKIPAERVQPVPGRHSQMVELRDCVELIQFAAHDRPEIPRNASCRLTVTAIPDVRRGVVSQRPDHTIAL